MNLSNALPFLGLIHTCDYTLVSIRKYKKVIKINLTTTLNFEILVSLMHRDINRGSGFYHSGNPLSIFEHTMHSPRPIKVKYHVVDVHMIPLEE